MNSRDSREITHPKLSGSTRRSLSNPSLETGSSYMVFAISSDCSKKLDVTKLENMQGVYTDKRSACQFAKNYPMKTQGLQMISALYEIPNGEKIDITSPIKVYSRTAFQRVCNHQIGEVDRCQYPNYIITKKKSFYCRICPK